MSIRPIFRSPCTHNLGLSFSRTTQRTFASSSIQFARPHIRAHNSRIAAAAPPRHPLLLTTFAAGSVAAYFATQPITHHDTSPAEPFSSSAYSHGRDAKVPLSKDGGRTLNPKAIRQISMGSIAGLGLGIVVSAFSKMLVLVAGLGIVFWQLAARRGYNIIPVERVQRYVKGVNLRSAINDNAAFKISFGLMFALTALGEL